MKTACVHCGKIWEDDPNVYVCNTCRAEGHAGFNANCPKCEEEFDRVNELNSYSKDLEDMKRRYK
jgi:predicted amidophosphoribosyltransferase